MTFYMRDEHGERVEITSVIVHPATSCGLTYGPAIRWFPRITLRRSGRYWAARWTAQNNSYMEHEGRTRRQALRYLASSMLIQRWPLITRPAPSD